MLKSDRKAYRQVPVLRSQPERVLLLRTQRVHALSQTQRQPNSNSVRSFGTDHPAAKARVPLLCELLFTDSFISSSPAMSHAPLTLLRLGGRLLSLSAPASTPVSENDPPLLSLTPTHLASMLE